MKTRKETLTVYLTNERDAIHMMNLFVGCIERNGEKVISKEIKSGYWYKIFDGKNFHFPEKPSDFKSITEEALRVRTQIEKSKESMFEITEVHWYEVTSTTDQ
ncbi:hypothetical protein ACFLY7_01060 [Patescibacteria group bacterium]